MELIPNTYFVDVDFLTILIAPNTWVDAISSASGCDLVISTLFVEGCDG